MAFAVVVYLSRRNIIFGASICAFVVSLILLFSNQQHPNIAVLSYIMSAGFWLWASMLAELSRPLPQAPTSPNMPNLLNALAASLAALGTAANLPTGWQPGVGFL
jgi:hypothetical protein